MPVFFYTTDVQRDRIFTSFVIAKQINTVKTGRLVDTERKTIGSLVKAPAVGFAGCFNVEKITSSKTF